MNIELIWIIILSISTPVAGVVGFAIQIRNVRKVKLENQKLELEIQHLKTIAEKDDRQIVIPTNKEVKEYALKAEDTVFYRRSPSHDRGESNSPGGGFLVVAAIALFVGYFIYDIYRLFSWVVSKF